ncbi:GTPase domain-containing protein [Mycobacterium frederiksbergense]|uniref:GTPase domain-containing protein n=1 Tax=Mycolicibacterium frederiksbergense TaxID=117567 RepID=UPI0021F3422F|nr:GTPase domain-containing protein [Mycolicibacterium frederiksbergense]MCV7046752.1 GTPase domain-containing protein [Mycolicibacterium frederiksbergense]
MSTLDIAAARAWLGSVPGGKLGQEADEQWQRLASVSEPVVTVYGAYDTGKSSLLRRLIVDSEVDVPEWLTISARHETFEVNEVTAAGCRLRDTPGFVTGADDARADMNTRLANAAVDLTDVAIVTVTPQLATAEFPALQELVIRNWVPGSLWFVISRFDEAGVDPESDLGGYHERGVRKTEELRRALELDEDVPVYVVSQDFAQMAGSDRNPDPQIWDDFRSWDGIAELLDALANLGARRGSSLRAAAAQRFWRQSVADALEGLRAELATYLDHQTFSEEGLRLRQSWLTQLDALQNSADADLRGRISETIGQAIDDQRDVDAIQSSLQATIEFWYVFQERNVEKLLRSVDDTIALERQRPSWTRLEELADSIRSQSNQSASTEEHSEVITPAVKQIAVAAVTALNDYQKLSTVRKPVQAATSVMNVSKGLAAATAVAPLIIEISSVAEQLLKGRAEVAERDRQRKAMEANVDRAGLDAAQMAMSEVEPLIQAARQAILDATAERVELRDGLTRLVGELETLVRAGEQLLGLSEPVHSSDVEPV